MELNALTAIGPLDGRYRRKVASLAPYFSEYALIRYRVWVEVEYFIALHEAAVRPLSPLDDAAKSWLRGLYEGFSLAEAQAVKDIEATTNHDVKAVEYWLKKQIEAADFEELKAQKEFIHFGLTSQDINNTAVPMSLRDALKQAYLPRLRKVISELETQAEAWAALPMLAHTHGQPASPTTLGKEVRVFVARLQAQADELAALPYPGKFGGATGNFNAHFIAYPETNWDEFGNRFLTDQLGLQRSQPTTQIDHYDGLSRIFDCLKRINTIMIDLCQDMWLYISMEYFRQEVKAGEVGSSAMPHKVNPIDFENAEGNCGLATALLEFLSRKLPVSRLQRDLTDSTVLRNLGLGVGYAFLAMGSLRQGLGKLRVNPEAMMEDLDDNWAVLAEAIQTILRREGYPSPYETLKTLTRGKAGITQERLVSFIHALDINDAVKTELKALRPDTYLGNAKQ